jgi:hypothetical protein
VTAFSAGEGTVVTTTEGEPAIGTGNPAGFADETECDSHASAYAREGKPKHNLPVPGSASRLRSVAELPEVWTDERPAVRQLWWYASQGKQAPEAGLARLILKGWGLVGCLANAALYAVAYLAALPCYVGRQLPDVDVFTVPRPSGRDIWHTGWATHSSPVIRWATVAVMPVVLGAYLLAWVFARFSRSLAAGLLYIVAAHVIGLPWLTWLP